MHGEANAVFFIDGETVELGMGPESTVGAIKRCLSARTGILPGHFALQIVDGEASDFPGLSDLLTVSQLSQMHTAEDTEETEVLHLFAIVSMPPRDLSLQSVHDLFKLPMEAHEQACALHQLENLNEAQQHLLLAAMNGFLTYLIEVSINPGSSFKEQRNARILHCRRRRIYVE
jgi:hypothetical protein